LLSALALAVWAQDGMAERCTHRDTTSCSLPGDSGPARDAHAMARTYGSAKEHRPDVQQAR